MTLVSVIIPTFNRMRWVVEAVASVLAQDVSDMEVLVVDDGSTDDTGAVLDTFGDAIRVVAQSHTGVSGARNLGIGLAGGEWIAFLDSDDLWLPGKLESQLRIMREHSALKIAQTEEIWVRNGKRLNPKKYHKKPFGYCFPLLLERCLVSPSAVIIHRDLLEEVGGFDESLPACEDYDLWLRIGCRYPIGLLDEPLIVKRGGHADQLSSTVVGLDQYRIHSLVKLLQTERLNPEQRNQALDMLRVKCRVYGDGCAKRGRREEAEAVAALPVQFED